jgi:hypothetical protein
MEGEIYVEELVHKAITEIIQRGTRKITIITGGIYNEDQRW